MARGLQEMNPLVSCTALPVTTSPETAVRDAVAATIPYTAVVMISPSLVRLKEVSDVVAEHGGCFFGGSLRGTLGWYFADLWEVYKYTIETTKPGSKPGDTDAERVVVEKEMKFTRLGDALAGEAAQRSGPRRGRGVDLYPVLCALYAEEAAAVGSKSGPYGRWGDKGEGTGPSSLSASFEVARGTGSLYREYVDEDESGLLAPALAAVLGGALGNDLTRTISRRGEPNNNLTAFYVVDGQLTVERRP